MSLIFPNPNNRKLGIGHWSRVAVLLLTIAALTWYGKFHKAEPRVSREHGLAVWTVPHSRGAGVLLVLPDDGDDSNRVATGLRVWLNPPREPALLADSGGVRYRGPAMAIVGDSLELLTLEQAVASVDTGGKILWLGQSGWPESLANHSLGPRQTVRGQPAPGAHDWFPHSMTGNDIQLDLRFLDSTGRNYILDLLYQGYRLRCWSSAQARAADTSSDSLSVGILLYRPDSAQASPPVERYMGSLIWHGRSVPGSDSTRIALGEPGSMALAATDNNWPTLIVRRMHLNGWRPREQ